MLGRTRALLRAAAAPGPYSRMMDMGGAPGATGPAKKFDLGKNNKIRAVALDFHLLTGSLSGGDDEAAAAAAEAAAAAASASVPPLPPAQPDTGVVEDLAGILGVELGGTMGRRRRGGEMEGDGDDLTGLAGDGPAGAAPPRGRRSALLDSRPPPPPGFDPQESELGASIFGALKRWGGGGAGARNGRGGGQGQGPGPGPGGQRHPQQVRGEAQGQAGRGPRRGRERQGTGRGGAQQGGRGGAPRGAEDRLGPESREEGDEVARNDGDGQPAAVPVQQVDAHCPASHPQQRERGLQCHRQRPHGPPHQADAGGELWPAREGREPVALGHPGSCQGQD